MFHPGDGIGPYTLIKLLGSGGFGEVWLAERRTTSDAPKFAIKLPFIRTSFDAIEKEVAVWKQAQGHPNILPLVEAESYDGQIALVSEYAPDGSLAEWLRCHNGQAPSVKVAVEITSGVLAGLEYLHAKRIIHRDLKPDNILLQGETPRLADFGISRVLKSMQSTRGIAGTFAFMAPETFRGVRSERTDLWSASVILYLLLSGRLPYEREDDASLIWAILNDEPEPLPPSVPQTLRELMARALAREPADRFDSAAALRQALVEIFSHHEEETRLATLPVLKRQIVGPPRDYSTTTSPSLPPAVPPPPLEPVVVRPPQPELIEPAAAPPPAAFYQPVFGKSVTKVIDLGGVAMEFALIPAGSFQMGSANGYDDERPVHAVTINRPFYLSKTEVTQSQWRVLMASNPSYFRGADRPVEQVSWDDALEFIRRLNARNDGYHYRLPSEAEWEYACRAGTTGDYAGELDALAWYIGNSGNEPHRVREKRANAWGLYDMHGNVWEWCQDWYHPDYEGAPADGSAWETVTDNQRRVVRGGSWYFNAYDCRSALRYWGEPGRRYYSFGFRIVAALPTT